MKKLILFAGIVAVLALIPLSSLMATQDEAPATTDQIMLVSLDEAPVVGPKTIICHITDDDALTGHVIHVSDNAVKAHCRHGVGDHNPNSGNTQIGNACSRGTTAANVCAKGCLNDDASGCR